VVDLAHDHGFEVRMIYVFLESGELQMERVQQRVLDGGHDVPADKIIARRARSFEQLAWFAQHVDQCFIFDNSHGVPELTAASKGKYVVQIRPLPSDLLAALTAAGVETPRLRNPDSWHLL
jgi:predicted ABC-type ATPase